MIEAGLYQLLSQDASIRALVADRIYHQVLPKDETLPALVLTGHSGGSINSLNGENELQPKRFQFDAYAGDAMTARTVIRVLRKLLAGYKGGLPDGSWVDGTQVEIDQDMPYEPGRGGYVFRSLLDLQFYFTQPE